MAKAKNATRGRSAGDISRNVSGRVSLAAAVDLRTRPWFRAFLPRVVLAAGDAASTLMRVPVQDANRILPASVRLVANIPVGASGDVVWTRGAAELLVHTSGVSLACAPGVLSLSVPVACDQLEKAVTAIVPLGVGTAERPAGLVMSAFSRPAVPDVVAAVWSEALTAFTWEVLLHLAGQLCAAAGRDQAGRPLVPASVAAASGVLILLPMARNQLKSKARP